jgi:hypothetical protein
MKRTWTRYYITVFYSIRNVKPLHHDDVSKSFRTGRLERILQMVKLSATRCSCIAILSVSLVSFVAITLCVASRRVFVVVVVVVCFFITQSGNF